MDNAPQREMTLDEWVDRLPTIHRARKELAALKAKLEAFRAAGLCKEDGTPIVKGVIGKLLVTEDGYLVGMQAEVFVKYRNLLDEEYVQLHLTRHPIQVLTVAELVATYSSREAALAARQRKDQRCRE